MFKFELGAAVELKMSEEVGEVRSRSESLTAEPQYFVLYQTAAGCQAQVWWGESELSEPLAPGEEDIPF